MFEKRYKLKDLYVAKICRVYKEDWIEGRSFLDSGINYQVVYDGPFCVFTTKDDTAKRVSTGVEYYLFDGLRYPKRNEWFVKYITPITQVCRFRDDVRSLNLRQIREIEEKMAQKYEEKREEKSEKEL